MALIEGRSIYIPLSELIDDVDAELTRMEKRKLKTQQELSKFRAKLANANFVANAPAEVVAQERQRVADFTRDLQQLDDQMKRVAALRK